MMKRFGCEIRFWLITQPNSQKEQTRVRTMIDVTLQKMNWITRLRTWISWNLELKARTRVPRSRTLVSGLVSCPRI